MLKMVVDGDGEPHIEGAGLMLACADLAMANGADELPAAMKAVTRMGSFCDYAMFGMQVTGRYLPQPIQCLVSDYPRDYAQMYADKGYVMVDPTVAHCQTTMEPVIWHPGMYDERSVELLEESRAAGLGYGLSIAYHESTDVKSMISFARDKPFSSKETEFVTAYARVVIACAHLAAKRTAVPRLIDGLRGQLTPRELQCLELLCDGKSNGVIAQILGISEATVEFHLRRLYDKLKVTTRYQAMAAGLQLLQGAPAKAASEAV